MASEAAAPPAAAAAMSPASFKVPQRAIFSEADLHAFRQSKTYADFVAFVRLCDEKVRGVAASDATYPVGPVVARFEEALEAMHGWVAEIPPLQQPMRFGNKAFRDWHARLVATGPDTLASLLRLSQAFKDEDEATVQAAASELLPYLTASFGHPTRIDYGTGHESSFVVCLYGLFRLRVLGPDDLAAAILRVFRGYLRVMRRLQTEYMLEPAGSHGVWGLDDYHCLVFLFGASQLIGHPTITPAAIHSEEVLQEHKDDFLYLSQVAFVKELKHGVPFAESSPMLNDISALPSWSKVNSGMLRLYEGEVLGKLPVIQHFVFGSFFPATWQPSAAPRPGGDDGLHPDPDDPYNHQSHTGMESTRAPWVGAALAHPKPPPKSPLQAKLEKEAAERGDSIHTTTAAAGSAPGGADTK